jgi:glycosyltransferase involved in cell wall biosynthesis
MSKPIRVLQIIGLACGGGVEAVIMNYYRHIDKNKIQFDFVVHKGAVKSFVDEAKSMGAKVYEVTPYTENIFKFTCEIYRIIKKERYQIVHSNMNSLSAFPLFAAYIAGVEVRILHNHTTDNKAEGLRTWVKRLLRPFAKIFANQYWACSNLAAEWMYGKKAIANNKVTIINNAIDLEQFKFNEQVRIRLRKELGLENCFVVGHVGRFMQQKNHCFLIDVFNKLVQQKQDARLLLIGDGPLKNEIEERVKKLELTEKVVFLGVRTDVASLYNVMDVFVLPSLYEGLGMVVVEAQVNGLPVLVSEAVPNEAKVNCNINFCNLNKPLAYWRNSIIQISKKERFKSSMIVDNNNFDIRYESKNIEKIYLKLNYFIAEE